MTGQVLVPNAAPDPGTDLDRGSDPRRQQDGPVFSRGEVKEGTVERSESDQNHLANKAALQQLRLKWRLISGADHLTKGSRGPDLPSRAEQLRPRSVLED